MELISSLLIISIESVFVTWLENLAPIPLDPIHLEGSLSPRTRNGDNKSFASHFMIEGYLEPRTIYSFLFVRTRSEEIKLKLPSLRIINSK